MDVAVAEETQKQFLTRLGIENDAALQNLQSMGYDTLGKMKSAPPLPSDLEACGFNAFQRNTILNALQVVDNSQLQIMANQSNYSSLYGATIENSWLKIPRHFRLLPFLGDKLFIREDYRKIEELIMAGKNGIICYLLIGTPGIGKSCFLIYLLCRLLQQQKTVVLHRHSDPKPRCFLFSKGQVTASSIESFGSHLLNPDVWYLVDTVNNPGMVTANTVFTCSPHRDHYRQFRKYVGCQTLYMPVWTSEEIFTVSRTLFPHRSQSDVENRFSFFGGVPRNVFSDTNMADILTPAIQRTSLNDCLTTNGELNSGSKDVNEGSHVIFHLSCTPPTYSVPIVTFASKWIQMQVVKHILVTEGEKLFKWIQNPNTATSISSEMQLQAYQGYVLDRLMCGGTFQIRHLVSGATTQLEVNPSKFRSQLTDWVFTDKEVGSMYVPSTMKSIPVVDAWIPSYGFFHGRLGNSFHVLGKTKQFVDAFNTIIEQAVGKEIVKRYYFVVPEETYVNFGFEPTKLLQQIENSGFGVYVLRLPTPTPTNTKNF